MTDLLRAPNEITWHPEIDQWCGTDLAADCHRQFRVIVGVYEHVHILRGTYDEVVESGKARLGYHEWCYPMSMPMRCVLDGWR